MGVFSRKSRVGIQGRLCEALFMRNAMPCVGLIVLAGCLTFIVAPDEQPALESQGTPYLAQAFPTIILDPGHGGRDEGAQSQGLVEKDLTLDLAERIEGILQPFGFPTM